MSIKKLKNGKYRVEVYLGKDSNGNRRREVRNEDSFSKAKTTEKELLKLKGRVVDPVKGMSELFDKYLEHLEHLNHKDNTRIAYSRNFKTWISPYFEFIKIKDIKNSTITDFFRYLEKKGATTKTIIYTAGRLKSIFDWAHSHQYIPSNLGVHCKVPAKRNIDDDVIKFHEKDDVIKLLSYMRKSEYYDITTTLYETGLRRAEACALLVECWDPKEKCLTVKYSLNNYVAKSGEKDIPGAFILDSTKGNEARSIYPTDTVCKILDRLCLGKNKNEPIFTTKNGKVREVIIKRGPKPKLISGRFISPANYAKDVFIEFQKRAGLSVILGAHGTRHTFGAQFMINGGSLDDLSEIMGHKDPKTTKKYAHFSKSHKKARAKLVDFTTQLGDHQMTTKKKGG